MKPFFVLLFWFCFLCFSFGQNPLEELMTDKQFQDAGGERYVTTLISNEEIKDKNSPHIRYYEAGVLCIPKQEETYQIDTITLSIDYNEDSIFYIKTNHSLKLSNHIIFYPYRERRNCLSTDKQSFVFAFGELNPVLEDVEISIDSSIDIEKLVENYNKELHTKKYKIRKQEPFSWIPINEWDSIGKTNVDFGLMTSVYEDEEENIYVVFESSYYTKFRQILCSGNHPPNFTIKKIQIALNEKGYKVPTDNIIGESTKAALIQFQKDENLPQGNLNVETLKALGIQF